jgi:hypothetical protein
MDPTPDDYRASNVEIIITDDVRRAGMHDPSHFVAVIGIPDVTKVEIEP